MPSNQFTDSLREWRKHRKMSQLDLALRADVSQRHVSWLETGRSQPSREMVVRLSDAMDIPLRERNSILNAAGFAKLYSERELDDPSMAPIKNILTELLRHHEPYPTVVFDKQWNIKMQNNAAQAIFEIGGPADNVWQAIDNDGHKNIALLTIHPNGLRQFISNWDEISGPFLRRLKKEALESGDAEVIARYEQVAQYAGTEFDEPIGESILPMMPIELELGTLKLSLCSVISTFGTAQDITANELRIETFYPTNEQTAKFFRE